MFSMCYQKLTQSMIWFIEVNGAIDCEQTKWPFGISCGTAEKRKWWWYVLYDSVTNINMCTCALRLISLNKML